MRWRLIVFTAELVLLLVLPTRQRRQLQLQAIEQTLLVDQHIVECLNGVVLKSQTAFQLIDTLVYVHQSTLSKIEIASQHQP